MQRVIIRFAMSGLLITGMICFLIDRGLRSAHAQGADPKDPFVTVETGQCETDDTYTIAIHGGLARLGGNNAAKISYLKPLLDRGEILARVRRSRY